MESKLTCVSGYWKIKNKHGDQFNEWFKNTLKINCPYVFFGDKESIELVKTFRGELPTYYIELNIEDFTTYKYRDVILTHPIHCPSIELKMIWFEKLFLLKKAYNLNPFNSEYFKWIDAGTCIYRDIKPPSIQFPNLEKLNLLPKDKFIYSSSQEYNENFVRIGYYYHHIAGTTYILHNNIIEKFIEIYKKYIDELVDKDNLWTDQDILTHIYKDNKHLFYKLCNGYGEITRYLY